MLLLSYMKILILQRIYFKYMHTDLRLPYRRFWKASISKQKQFSVLDLWRVPVLNMHILYLNLHD